MVQNNLLKILVPLDGSSTAEAILPTLTPFLRTAPSEITLVYVGEDLREANRAGLTIERSRAELLNAGIPTVFQVEWGKPAEEIVRVARRGFDLVAMGTHGRSGIQRLMMGSVAEEVMRKSTVPLLMCRLDSRIGDWKRIVVALDGTPGAEAILPDVRRIARAAKASIHLVRVSLPLLTVVGFRGVSLEADTPDPAPYLEKVQDDFAKDGVLVSPQVRTGNPAVEIATAAREVGAGLICMTTEGRPDLVAGLNASVAAEVIRTAPCPVLVRRQARFPAER